MHVPYVTYKSEDGIYLKHKFGNYHYTISGVISFNNHIHLLHMLNPTELSLLNFLAQKKMDAKTNEIVNSLSLRTEFIDFMKRNCAKTYQDRTVNLAFGKLKKVGYIIKRSKAKRTIINPLYFFRGTMQEREKLFNSLLYEATHPKTLNQDILEKLKLNP